MAETKAKRGRPTLFSDRLVERLLELATKGATDVELAEAANVSVATLKNWKGRHPDFLAALKNSKDLADQLVEASLFRRATGYSHPAVKYFCDKGEIIAQDYVEHYPPDTTACIFWLKNRQPERWREKQEVQVKGLVPFVVKRRDGSTLEIGAKVEGDADEDESA